MSLIGKQISPFKVQAFHGGEFVELTEKSLEGQWAVLVFYPADFTFVCPTELGDLADHYEEFQKLGCEVYSVSTDSHFVHKAWHDASDTIRKVRYPMISDPTGSIAKDFEVLVTDSWQALRGSFVLSPEGQIVAYEVNDMGIGRDAEELLRRVQAAQYVAEHGNQVCPAKWRPGDMTLTPGMELIGKL